MDSISQVKQTTKHNKVHNVTWKEIDTYINKIMKDLNGVSLGLKDIYAVPRGGFIPAVILSNKLDLPLEFNRYKIRNHTLVVDDIEDSGNTIRELKSVKPNAVYAVLFSKQDKPNVNYYAKKVSMDTWVKFPWETK